ncbi:MAG: hypothetical protein AAF135_09155 [Bacteroidota bacterium]
MPQLIEAIGGLIFVSGAVLIVYFLARFTFLIKKMRIEKGLPEKPLAYQLTKTDVAFAILGVGIGLLIATPLSTLELQEDTMDLMIWGVVLISGAGGLLVANQRKK